jgi:hypothetical protein
MTIVPAMLRRHEGAIPWLAGRAVTGDAREGGQQAPVGVDSNSITPWAPGWLLGAFSGPREDVPVGPPLGR